MSVKGSRETQALCLRRDPSYNLHLGWGCKTDEIGEFWDITGELEPAPRSRSFSGQYEHAPGLKAVYYAPR